MPKDISLGVGGSGGEGGGLTEAEVKALIRNSRDTDLPFTGTTGLTLVSSATALTVDRQVKFTPSLSLMQVRLATTDYRVISPALGVGNTVKLLNSSGVAVLNTTITRFEEFDESAASDTLDISLDSLGTIDGTETGTGYTLNLEDADAELWNSYVDERAEANFDSKVEGEKFEASDGFEFVGSGSDLQAGKVWVESGVGADDMKMRARDAGGADTLAGKIHPGTVLLFGDVTSSHAVIRVATVGTVTGAGANRVFSYTFSDHHAVGTLTGDQPLRIFPDLPSAWKSIVAPRSVPVWAIDPGSGVAGQVIGVRAGGDIGLITDKKAVPQGLSATGGDSIGTTTFGQVNDFSNLSAAGLLPVPHPNQSSTPAGTGEITVTPQSASSKFKCEFDLSFGYINSALEYRLSFALARKIGTGNWTVANQKTNIIQAIGINGWDLHRSGFYLDSPNTTDSVIYKWLVARRNSTDRRIYPVSQSVAVTEFP